MADSMTAKMSQASAKGARPPQQGERFRCAACGMEIKVTTGCKCQDPQHARFECCGQEMTKV
jgi:hypothetical protein